MAVSTRGASLWKDGAVAAVVYALLATVTISVASKGHEVAAIWPANAFLAALLLLRPRSSWLLLLGAGFLANAVANLATRGDIQAPAFFGLFNMAEVLIVASALAGRPGAQSDGDPRIVWRFALWAGLIAPAVSAALGGTTAAFFYGEPPAEAWRTWYLADALGLLICMPFFHALLSGEFRRYLEALAGPRGWESALVLGAVAVASIVLFWAVSLPVFFLIELPVLVATFRLGMSGVKLTVPLVALIGTAATAAGHGPIVAMSDDPATRAAVLQSFLAVIMLTGLPVAAALAARRQLIARLSVSERSLRLLAAQSPVLLLHFDPQGLCSNAIGAAEPLLGAHAGALIGRRIEDVHPLEGHRLRAALLEAEAGARPIVMELSGLLPSVWIEAKICSSRDAAGVFLGTVVALHDISVHRNRAQAMAKMAETDSLTGLLNRNGFMRRLDDQVIGDPGTPFALALIDIDRFKTVNDQHGHLVGDHVLREIGGAIAAEQDDGCIGARLGGDEFVLLFPGFSVEQAEAACVRISGRVGAIRIDAGHEPIAFPSISCGIAARPAGHRAGSIMLDADRALYRAKADGRGCIKLAEAEGTEPLLSNVA
jgi:diguanylate cyclase (GGDEF)-like protein